MTSTYEDIQHQQKQQRYFTCEGPHDPTPYILKVKRVHDTNIGIQKRYSMTTSKPISDSNVCSINNVKSSNDSPDVNGRNETFAATIVKSFSENDLRIFSNPNQSSCISSSYTSCNNTNTDNNHNNINTTSNVGPIRADYVTIEAESKLGCNYSTRSSGINSFRKKIIHQNSVIHNHSPTTDTNTIVVVPSMDLDGDELKRISKGVDLYEERQLYHLLLLSDPSFRVVFLSTRPICQDVVRYYLTLDNCSDFVLNDRLSRLFLLTPGDIDCSMSKLSDKVVKDHKLIATMKEIVKRVSHGESAAGLNVFCGSDTADDLASQLGLRLLEASGSTLYYGSKQGR